MQGEDRVHGRVYHIRGWTSWSDRRKVAELRKLAEEYGGDPEMRRLATRIVEAAGAPPRDGKAQAAALLAFVQNHVYYTNEAGEQIQSPWYTLTHRCGDCFAEGTLVLRDDYTLGKIEDVRAGDRIWGRDRWSRVVAWADKGDLPITEVSLNNGSTLRLTDDHKLWVKSCEMHGTDCPDWTKSSQNCKNAGRATTWVVRHVSEAKPGWVLLQPDAIADGGVEDDVDLAWLDGVYVADGWCNRGKVCISGQDGKPKEEQKRRVVGIAEKYGETTYWNRKYVALHAGKLRDRLRAHGSGAEDKGIPGLNRTREVLLALDEGLQADASRNTHGAGWTFGTINRKIAVQYRVLQRILGRSTSWRCVVKHGGFGSNPIYRVGVRMPTRYATKPLRITGVARTGEVARCYDVETDDKYVYLPEADCTVHNCDDMGLLLASLAESLALGWRFALGGRDRAGRPVRWIEGQPWPAGATITHIYVFLGWPALTPTTWAAAEPTIRGLPLGHDVVTQGVPDGMRGGSDLRGGRMAGWGALPAWGTDVVEVPVSTGVLDKLPAPVRTVARAIDWPGLLNTVIGGTLTALVVTYAVKTGQKG